MKMKLLRYLTFSLTDKVPLKCYLNVSRTFFSEMIYKHRGRFQESCGHLYVARKFPKPPDNFSCNGFLVLTNDPRNVAVKFCVICRTMTYVQKYFL